METNEKKATPMVKDKRICESAPRPRAREISVMTHLEHAKHHGLF
jgi:hypothetical protein